MGSGALVKMVGAPPDYSSLSTFRVAVVHNHSTVSIHYNYSSATAELGRNLALQISRMDKPEVGRYMHKRSSFHLVLGGQLCMKEELGVG